MSKKKGLFITFEGGEGCGKSTQARLLSEELHRQGISVMHTREPGGTSIAEAVRKIILNPRGRVDSMTELFLYEAARAQHMAEFIKPALTAGKIVICERFTDSTEAYQGWGRGLSRKDIQQLNQIAAQGLKPDLTFLLDIPVEKGLLRARALSKKITSNGRRSLGGDRLERESLAFHNKVRKGFQALARREPKRFCVIPWADGIESVHQKIIQAFSAFLKKKKKVLK